MEKLELSVDSDDGVKLVRKHLLHKKIASKSAHHELEDLEPEDNLMQTSNIRLSATTLALGNKLISVETGEPLNLIDQDRWWSWAASDSILALHSNMLLSRRNETLMLSTNPASRQLRIGD